MTESLTPSPRYLNALMKAGLPLFALRKYTATVWDAKHQITKKIGKVPLSEGWRTASPMTQENAEYWMSTGGNIGVRLTDDWLIVDFDPRNAGPEPQKVWDAFKLRFGIDLGRYAIVKTGGGGYHVFMKNPKKFRVHKGLEEFPGIDFLSEGRYIVAPGSIHPDTLAEYKLVVGSMEFFASSPAPEGLLNSLKWTPPKQSDQDEIAFGGHGIDGVAALLAHLDPVNYGTGHGDAWFGLMCSAHFLSGGLAEDEFVAWSRGDSAYDNDLSEKQTRIRWRSLSTSADHKTLNRMQLHRDLMALGKGHVLPRPKAGAEFASMFTAAEEAEWQTFGSKPVKDDDGIVIEGVTQNVSPDIDLVQEEEIVDVGDMIVRRMDKDYALVLHGGASRIVRWMPDKTTIDLVASEGQWTSLSGTLQPEFVESSQIKKTMHPERIRIVMPGEESAKLNFEFDYWYLATKNRYSSTEFAPGRPLDLDIGGKRVMNLWRGWPYDLERLAAAEAEGCLPSTKLIHEFLWTIIANGDDKIYQYILNWMAWGYQNPADPIGVMIVLQGGQGEGKGTLAELWSAPWGVNFFAASNPEDVFSRFSGHLLNKAAVFLDEAFWAGDQGKLGRLKAMITEKSISIESKGLNIVSSPNSMKFIAASNEDWVVPADVDNRRFQVFEVSPAWKNKIAEHWSPLRDEMRGGGRAAFFYEMLTRKIPKGWHPQRDRVMTEAMKRQARITQGPIAEWLHLIYKGGIPYAFENGGNLYVPAAAALENFKAFAQEGFTSKWKFATATNFEHEIKQLFGRDAMQQQRTRAPTAFLNIINDGGSKDLMSPWDGQGRCACYKWPSYKRGREIIDTKFTFNELEGEVDFSGDDSVVHDEWGEIL